MRFELVLLAALLPFLHEEPYEAKVKSCDANGITLLSEGTTFQSTLFNIEYNQEDGWKDTCAIVTKADSISFEVDDTVKMEEVLPVYLFADGKMVQVTLLEQEKAAIAIHNPNYAYIEELEMAQSGQSVMAAPASALSQRKAPIHSYIVYFFVLILWAFLFYLLIYSHRPFHMKQMIQKNGKNQQHADGK